MTGIALIGCGKWGTNYLRTLNRLVGCKLLYVCDLDQKIQNTISSRFPQIKTVDDYKVILQDADVRAVIVATPPASHYEIASHCLNSGKAVLVEKPLTDSYQSAKALVDLAETSGQVMMIGHLMLYHPAVELIKNYINRCYLGDIKFLHFERTNCHIFRRDVNVLADLAVHDIAVLLYLLEQEPIWVRADGFSWTPDLPLGTVLITIGFASDLIAQIHANWHYPQKTRCFNIVGTKKMLTFNDLAAKNNVSTVSIDGQEVDKVAMPGEPLYWQCVHFLDCVNNAKQPLSGPRGALQVMKIMETVKCSLAIKDVVFLKGELL